MIMIVLSSLVIILCFILLSPFFAKPNTQTKQATKKPIQETSKVTFVNPIECGIIISPQKSISGKVFFYDLSGNRISKIPRGKRDIALANNCFLGQFKNDKSKRWVPVLRSDVERMMTNDSFVRAHSKSVVKESGESNSDYVSWIKEDQIGYLGSFGHLKADIDFELNEAVSLVNSNRLYFSRGLSDGSFALLETKMRDDDFKQHLLVELKSLGAEEDEICAFGFILGFSSHIQILGQSKGLTDVMQSPDDTEALENGGGKYMSKLFADAPIHDSAKLYDKISQLATTKTVPKGVNLDDYENVHDVPWYRLISTIAFVNFVFHCNQYPFHEELKNQFPNENQLISFLANQIHEQNFNAFAPSDVDVELAIKLLAKNKPLEADNIVSLMMETINSSREYAPNGLVAYSDFESCWLAGHLISKAFVQWDQTFAWFIRDHCFVPIWNSDYHMVLHSLPCALALDELIEPSDGMVLHRYLNPFLDLKAHSQLIRCLTSRMNGADITMRDVGDYYGSEKAIILRILNDEFCLLAQRCSTVKSGGVVSIPAYQSHINSYDDELLENDGVYNANEILNGNLLSQWLVSNRFTEILNAIALASYAEKVLREAISIKRGESIHRDIEHLTVAEFHRKWLDIMEKNNRPSISRQTNSICRIASKFDLLCPTLIECIATSARIKLVS